MRKLTLNEMRKRLNVILEQAEEMGKIKVMGMDNDYYDNIVYMLHQLGYSTKLDSSGDFLIIEFIGDIEERL